jgi:hypothetical protein
MNLQGKEGVGYYKCSCIDWFLLILISELSVWYEVNLLMALPDKFEFLSICRRKNWRIWL